MVLRFRALATHRQLEVECKLNEGAGGDWTSVGAHIDQGHVLVVHRYTLSSSTMANMLSIWILHILTGFLEWIC